MESWMYWAPEEIERFSQKLYPELLEENRRLRRNALISHAICLAAVVAAIG